MIIMDMPHEDIILGISWLRRYSTVIDLRMTTVMLRADDGSLHEINGSDPMHNGVVVSAVRAARLISQGCTAFWCYAL